MTEDKNVDVIETYRIIEPIVEIEGWLSSSLKEDKTNRR